MLLGPFWGYRYMSVRVETMWLGSVVKYGESEYVFDLDGLDCTFQVMEDSGRAGQFMEFERHEKIVERAYLKMYNRPRA